MSNEERPLKGCAAEGRNVTIIKCRCPNCGNEITIEECRANQI